MEFQAAMKIICRMCTTLKCDECPLQDLGVYTCRVNLYTYPQEAEAILAKWAAEHPEKTLMDDFFEKHPKAKKRLNGTPALCAGNIEYVDDTQCLGTTCSECWHRPLEEAE